MYYPRWLGFLFTIKHHYSLILVLLMVIQAGCSIPPVRDNNVIDHVISISRDGVLEKIVAGQSTPVDRAYQGKQILPRDFDHILSGIRNHPRNSKGEIEVLLYIHGGMNTKADAMNRAQKKFKKILSSDKSKYPIFINWRSGPYETYVSHLTRIRQGEISRLARATAPIYLLTDLANSIVNTPKSWLITGEHSWRAVAKRDDSDLQRYSSNDDNIFYTGNGKRTGIKRKAQWIITSPLKIVTTPLVYTMAKPSWDIMKRRTNTLFNTPNDFKHVDWKKRETPGTGALSVFLQQLDAMISYERLPVKITLIGHSMGAIVVNKMLRMNQRLPYKNIVHMGSADSIDNLFNSVIPYLDKNKDAKFYSLSLHPDNEDREVNAHGAVPSGSMLVWIDQMYTAPATVFDRTSGRWVNMKEVLHMLPKKNKERMFFKIFGHDEKTNQPQKHKEFGKIEYWLESTWWK